MNVVLYIPSSLYAIDVNRMFVDTLAYALGDSATIIHNGKFIKKDHTILHIFGCADYTALRIMHKAASRKIPTLLSPIGTLQPWACDSITKTVLKTITFQKKMMVGSGAIHVWSKAEADRVSAMVSGCNMAYIPNCIVTNSILPDEMSRQFHVLYQKIIDSSASLLVDSRLREVVYLLLQVGLDATLLSKRETVTLIEEKANACSPSDWRTITIYAYNEGITDYIRTAVKQLHLTVTLADANAIDRFATVSPYSGKSLITAQNVKAAEMYLAIHNLLRKIDARQASLANYAEMFTLLRRTDYDERELVDLLRKHRIIGPSRRLMGVLQEITGLSEGFIPSGLYNR